MKRYLITQSKPKYIQKIKKVNEYVYKTIIKNSNMKDKKQSTVFTLEVVHDEVVAEVVKDFNDRSALGQEKYGTTLDANNHDDFLQHLKEELMDATLYIAKIQKQLKVIKNK